MPRASSSSSLLLSSLELSDTKVYAPQIRALLGTDSHSCEVVVLNPLIPADRQTQPLVVEGISAYSLDAKGFFFFFFFFFTFKPRVE